MNKNIKKRLQKTPFFKFFVKSKKNRYRERFMTENLRTVLLCVKLDWFMVEVNTYIHKHEIGLKREMKYYNQNLINYFAVYLKPPMVIYM